MMRVIKTKDTKDHLCQYCQLDFATCPKANHVKFGDGSGNDNVIECSEFVCLAFHHTFPIEGTNIFVKSARYQTIHISLIMTLQQLQQFFHERPQLSAHGFALEAGISQRLLSYILSGERNLTQKTIDKILPVMQKYGFKW